MKIITKILILFKVPMKEKCKFLAFMNNVIFTKAIKYVGLAVIYKPV